MTFVRPSAAPRDVIVLAPPVVSSKRTQVLTSDAIRPVLRAASKPPAAPIDPPPAHVDTPAAPVDDKPAPPHAWTLERKLLAANMILGGVVLLEFLVL